MTPRWPLLMNIDANGVLEMGCPGGHVGYVFLPRADPAEVADAIRFLVAHAPECSPPPRKDTT